MNNTLTSRGLASFDLYPYNPSAVAAYAFLVLFAIPVVIHLVYMLFLRAWFAIPLILGCIGEISLNPSRDKEFCPLTHPQAKHSATTDAHKPMTTFDQVDLTYCN